MNAYLYTMKQHARDGAAQLVAYVPLLVLGTFLLVAMNTFMLMGSSSLTQGGGGVAQHSAVLSSYGNGAAVLGALSDGELEQVRYRRLGTVGGGVQAVCDNRNETYCKCSIVCGYILQVGRWAATEATLFEHIWSITPQNQRVLVDVGGNVGFFTTLSSAWGARIVVFEPQTAPRRLLQLSVDANGAADRVTVYPYGVGASEGTASVNPGSDWAVGSLQLGSSGGSGGGGLRVVPLAGYAPKGGITILKVDTEGFEAQVFEGAWDVLPRVAYVIAEVRMGNARLAGRL